jgi:hypothetical protein
MLFIYNTWTFYLRAVNSSEKIDPNFENNVSKANKANKANKINQNEFSQ